jgi:hypothetical protein
MTCSPADGETEDFSEHLSVVGHPGDELYDYLQRSFARPKQEQAHQLEATQGKR